MSEMEQDADPMFEALLYTMAVNLAVDAQSVKHLCISHGRTVKDTLHKVVDIYSPPRVTRELAEAPGRTRDSEQALRSA